MTPACPETRSRLSCLRRPEVTLFAALPQLFPATYSLIPNSVQTSTGQLFRLFTGRSSLRFIRNQRGERLLLPDDFPLRIRLLCHDGCSYFTAQGEGISKTPQFTPQVRVDLRLTCLDCFGLVHLCVTGRGQLKPSHVVARGEAGGPQQYSCCRSCENGGLLLSFGGLRRARLKLRLRPSCCAICELPLILCLRLLVGQASFLQTCSRRSHAMLVGVLPQASSTGSYHHRSV